MCERDGKFERDRWGWRVSGGSCARLDESGVANHETGIGSVSCRLRATWAR